MLARKVVGTLRKKDIGVFFKVPSTGLEPVTPRLGIWCSILMSYGGNLFNYSKFYSKLIKVYKD